jgi:hypothetical protein
VRAGLKVTFGRAFKHAVRLCGQPFSTLRPVYFHGVLYILRMPCQYEFHTEMTESSVYDAASMSETQVSYIPCNFMRPVGKVQQ